MKIKYLHTMVRINDIDTSKKFYCDLLGLEEIRRHENEKAQFTLIFLAAPGQEDVAIELTYNWNPEEAFTPGRNFGHLAFEVDNIYQVCEKLANKKITINRPPRDGRMAFVRSPDNISIELLQKGDPLEQMEPWKTMGNTGWW